MRRRPPRWPFPAVNRAVRFAREEPSAGAPTRQPLDCRDAPDFRPTAAAKPASPPMSAPPSSPPARIGGGPAVASSGPRQPSAVVSSSAVSSAAVRQILAGTC